MRIEELCEIYGFTFEEMANHIKIRSKFDTWYIDKWIEDFNKREIILYHENSNTFSVSMFKGFKKSFKNTFNINNNKIWHKQTNRKFNLNEVFKYIAKHDRKYNVKCEVTI
ncbi:hypothetical protein [Pseudobacteroides cellulosolvens]|uniref:Uncharacterized protein n=1 Tax=Pseudobacteroides cellulosolvens ATCC 35603 = DSM 2933 TaxID=398512 RepID=A0A0L6JGY5_9FIRM|nr:hypothetical protein [Pseudobacteroides cellulosolvens]KNY24984.1 hypothetical protein Bccel_0241 [Pseudobacteroides cellulosolvens ATCC 35603 = DSM 2933]